jgi:predicted dehydrogenase
MVRHRYSGEMGSEQPPLRIGVIGYGYWGPNLARNAAQHPETELVAIADRDPRRLGAARVAHPAVARGLNEHDLLADPSIDAVLIATPPETHCALVVEALERGKHVLVEKPLATSVADAARMVATARACGRTLAVDHTFLFTGAVRKMKEYFVAGEMGEVYYYDATRINLGIFQGGTNVIWDLAPHDLAIMLHLLQARVKSVSAVGARHVDLRNENIAYITLQFEDSLLAHFHVNWLAPTKVRRIIIGASAKMLVYDDMEPDEKLKVYDSGVELVAEPEEIYGRLVEYRTGDIVVPKLDKREALATEVGHFVNVIRGNEAAISDGAFGAEVVRIIDAAQRSLRRGGIPEPIEYA